MYCARGVRVQIDQMIVEVKIGEPENNRCNLVASYGWNKEHSWNVKGFTILHGISW